MCVFVYVCVCVWYVRCVIGSLWVCKDKGEGENVLFMVMNILTMPACLVKFSHFYLNSNSQLSY